MLKDLKLAVQAAQSAGASVPMASQAEALYQMFVGLGGEARDFSAIIKLLDGSWADNAVVLQSPPPAQIGTTER